MKHDRILTGANMVAVASRIAWLRHQMSLLVDEQIDLKVGAWGAFKVDRQMLARALNALQKELESVATSQFITAEIDPSIAPQEPTVLKPPGEPGPTLPDGAKPPVAPPPTPVAPKPPVPPVPPVAPKPDVPTPVVPPAPSGPPTTIGTDPNKPIPVKPSK